MESGFFRLCSFRNPKAHTPSNLVVAHWTADVESTAPLDFLWQHDLWTPFGCLMSCKIRSIISVCCDFTTKSDGIWNFRQLNAFEQAELILQAALDPTIARRAKKGEFVTCFDHFDLLQTAIN